MYQKPIAIWHVSNYDTINNTMEFIRTIKIENLSDRKYPLDYVTFEKSGQQKQNEVYHRPSGAAVLLIDIKRKTVLLTQQFRLPPYLNGEQAELLEVCAGIIDKGETPEESINREVKEELGYQIESLKKVAEAYLSPAGITEVTYFFIAHYSFEMKVAEGGGKKEEGEDIHPVELSFNEVRSMLQQGLFKDAKTILLIQHAMLNGLIPQK